MPAVSGYSRNLLRSFVGRRVDSPVCSYGKAYSPPFMLEGRTMNGMTMDRKIISAARGMGREAYDA